MPLIARDATDRHVLAAVVDAEPHGITRPELAGRLGLSATTISAVVERLRGSVEFADGAPGRSGPPPKVLRVPDDAGVVIAMEIQHWGIRVRAFGPRGQPLGETVVEATPDDDNPMDTLRRLADMARTMLGSRDPSRVIGVGVAIAGPVEAGAGSGDRRQGVVREDAMMGPWGGISPATELAQQLLWDCPFRVDNDATLATVAERRWGAARDAEDAIYVGWGRGIGAGLVVSGSIARGSSGIAGEIGHCAVVLTSEHRARVSSEADESVRLQACPRCGRYCLESVAGIAAIVADAGLPADSQVTDLLERAEAELSQPDASRRARLAIRTAAGYFGQVLGTCVNLLNPSKIVIGGEMPPSAASLYRGELISQLKLHAIGTSFGQVDVVPSGLGTDAVLRGAAAHVLEHDLANYLLAL